MVMLRRELMDRHRPVHARAHGRREPGCACKGKTRPRRGWLGRRATKPLRHDDLVAALGRGFWIALLDESYLIRYPGKVGLTDSDWCQIIPGATSQPKTVVRARMNEIRILRNRVFHHEPVWPKSSSSHSRQEAWDRLCEALRWLDGGARILAFGKSRWGALPRRSFLRLQAVGGVSEASAGSQ